MASKGKKIKESKKVRKDGEGLRAANKPEYVTGTGQKLWRVHLKQDCMHRICDIHNPPQGLPESDWPTHWRADRGLMERICPHGIGHPTKAHMEFLKEMDAVRGTENAKWEGIHGCDGCCGGNYDPEEEDEPFVLDEEFEPYFDPAPSDWERGLSWDELLASLMDRPFDERIPPEHELESIMRPRGASENHIWGRTTDPEWVDHDATPNGIGPVCKDCHLLIDWHPVDHALGCPWL